MGQGLGQRAASESWVADEWERKRSDLSEIVENQKKNAVGSTQNQDRGALGPKGGNKQVTK